MSSFSFTNSPIEDLKIVTREPKADNRGFLSRLFCAEEFKRVGWEKSIAQINQTVTIKMGTIRGLHFQLTPYAEMKLVSCLQGQIWDVAVDLRQNSPTFLSWHAEELSSENCRALLIPKGFAHGFQSLSDNCELIYLHSEPYMPTAERVINPNDSILGISWPMVFTEISQRDADSPRLSNDFRELYI